MIKHLSQLKHKIGEREFLLLCENDSPLDEIKIVLFEFLKVIGKIEDSAKAAIEQSKNEDPQPEPVEEINEQC